MALWAGELLRLDLPQTDKRLLTIVETDGCFSDGVAVATNCWVGRRTMRIEDCGKVAATFADTHTGQVLRLAPQSQARDLAQSYAAEARDKWEAMLLGYQRMAADRLFTVQAVELNTPVERIVSHPGRRVACVHCGEEIINEREVITASGFVCRTCAGQSYYRPRPAPSESAHQQQSIPLAASLAGVTEHELAEQRTRELLAAFEVSQEIVAQLDLDQLLRSITNRARDLFQAQAAFLCLVQPTGATLELVESSGWSGAALGLQQPIFDGLARQVIGNGQTISLTTPCAACAVLGQYGPGCCHATPLRVGEATLGALCIICQPGKVFDPDRVRSLQLLANAAAIAISNARLAATARQEAAHAAAAAEREQLAAELHDHLAQTLGFLNLKADQLQGLINHTGETAAGATLAQMKTAITAAYTQVRAALTGLRQPSEATNLRDSLAACLADFRMATGVAVNLSVASKMEVVLAPVTQTQIIQIVREALTNIQRHAQAQQVWVKAERRNGLARFTVADDGCGFDPQAALGEHHLGLKIMRLRAERSGGQLTIQSAPGAGAQVVVELPIIQDKDKHDPISYPAG
jgi:formylmethanofuran dehydrogenase subunit E